METVDSIENIYESMLISTSIVVCDSSPEMAFMIDALESKSFPCRYVCSSKKESLKDSPNKMFVCMKKEFNSPEFWDTLDNTVIDCIFCIGQSVFSECLKQISARKDLNSGVRQFIFTL